MDNKSKQHYIDDDNKSNHFTFNNEHESKRYIFEKDYNTSLNQLNNNLNFTPLTSDFRISNLERRLDATEKMLKFYEEMLRLKDDEKKNEQRIDNNKINELNKKIIHLEEHIKHLHRRLNDQNEIINEKLEIYEKKFNKINENRNNIGEFYASKLAEIEALINKNNILIDSSIEDKLEKIQMNTDGKLEDMLNLINDVSKNNDNLEFNIVESKESIRDIQKDHIDFIKIVSILKEKVDGLDYIIEQITELKQRYQKILQIYGEHSQEEDRFLNKILNEENENK